jgi:hypothetical protein
LAGLRRVIERAMADGSLDSDEGEGWHCSMRTPGGSWARLTQESQDSPEDAAAAGRAALYTARPQVDPDDPPEMRVHREGEPAHRGQPLHELLPDEETAEVEKPRRPFERRQRADAGRGTVFKGAPPPVGGWDLWQESGQDPARYLALYRARTSSSA